MPGFVKRFDDAAMAAEALRRSNALAGQGVPTPAAGVGRIATEVRFARLDGRCGTALPVREQCALLAVVGRLHRARIPGLSRYDPFLRIRPRLALASRIPAREILREPVPRGGSVLHGDLHVGQFVRDAGGKVWIVDLDDLALGPPQADAANFAAHLATSRRGRDIDTFARRIRAAWQGHGLARDDTTFERYLRFALLRRHLKLREAGRYDFEAEILGYLRESSNFSIR